MSEIDVTVCSYFIDDLYSFSFIDFPVYFHQDETKNIWLNAALNGRTDI